MKFQKSNQLRKKYFSKFYLYTKIVQSQNDNISQMAFVDCIVSQIHTSFCCTVFRKCRNSIMKPKVFHSRKLPTKKPK